MIILTSNRTKWSGKLTVRFVENVLDIHQIEANRKGVKIFRKEEALPLLYTVEKLSFLKRRYSAKDGSCFTVKYFIDGDPVCFNNSKSWQSVEWIRSKRDRVLEIDNTRIRVSEGGEKIEIEWNIESCADAKMEHLAFLMRYIWVKCFPSSITGG